MEGMGSIARSEPEISAMILAIRQLDAGARVSYSRRRLQPHYEWTLFARISRSKSLRAPLGRSLEQRPTGSTLFDSMS